MTEALIDRLRPQIVDLAESEGWSNQRHPPLEEGTGAILRRGGIKVVVPDRITDPDLVVELLERLNIQPTSWITLLKN